MLVLKDIVEIKATPEKIWAFFIDLEKNYKSWHPQDHVLFRWTKGRPMATGSCFYAEELMKGKVKKFRGRIGEVVPYRKIVFINSFPVSTLSPKFEWQIEPGGVNSIFIAVNYMRGEKILRRLLKDGMEDLIEIGKKHMKEEGENLKEILEKQ
jgi:hypothetical protein